MCAASCGNAALASLLQTLRWARARRRARHIADGLLTASSAHGLNNVAAVDVEECDEDGRRALEQLFPPSALAARLQLPQIPGREPKRSRGATLGRLLSLSRPERCMISVATVALMGSTICQMAMPALVGTLLSVVTDPHEQYPQATLARVTIDLVAVFAVGAAFSFWRGYLFSLAGERVVARLRKGLFRHLLSLEVGFFDESKTGELMNRLSSDTAVLQSAVTINVSMGLRFAAQVIIALCAVLLYSWSLTLVMLSVVPIIVFSGVLYARFVKKIAKKYQALLADASSNAQETLGAVRTVRSLPRR